MPDESTCQRIDDVEADREWLQFAYEQYAPGLRRFVVGVVRDREGAIVKSRVREVIASGGGLVLFDSVSEGDSLDDVGQEFAAVKQAPFLRGGLRQLEHHGQAGGR